jgi:glycosyltransferase involved in cell wall biosynthesis
MSGVLESTLEGAGRLNAFVKRGVERFVAKRSRYIVVLTQESRHFAIDYLRVPAWKVHCIAPGVDSLRFRPRDVKASQLHLGLPADAIIVGCIRRLVKRMGIDDLIAAWADICESSVDRRVLLIAGTGPLQPHLEALVDALDLRQRVVFLGRLDDDVTDFLLSMRFYSSPQSGR